MLGKFQVPGRPTNLDKRRTRAYCACSMCGLGFFVFLFSTSIISSVFLSLGDGPI